MQNIPTLLPTPRKIKLTGEQYNLSVDKELLPREFFVNMDLLWNACRLCKYGFGSSMYSPNFLSNDLERIITEYQHLWLSGNRPGVLNEHLSYFDQTRKEYQ